MKQIAVRGAREHNLKNISCSLPREKLVVITGLSGSGKSSLAFDTIYAEGQRRYVESLSAYARQFLGQNQKPDVDGIDGLSPAISIEQKSTSNNPRSTVGTLTEIYDYLRLLYARIGVPHCPGCGRRISSQSVQQIVDQLLALPAGSRFVVMAPVVEGRKGEYRKDLEDLAREGFLRVRIDGETVMLASPPDLDKRRRHTIELVIDRLVVKEEARSRISDSVELALKKGRGVMRAAVVDGDELTFSEAFACESCSISLPEVTPRLFSFNSPFGACAACDGLGQALEIDPAKVVPDGSLSLQDGAVAPWAGRFQASYLALLASVAKHLEVSMRVPWAELPRPAQRAILHGTREAVAQQRGALGGRRRVERPFEGVVPYLTRRLAQASERGREDLEAYCARRPCPVCKGARLKPEALAVQVAGRTIHQLSALPIGEVQSVFAAMKLGPREARVGERVLKEICERLSFLEAVGLEYLSLERGAATLSGGEAQRIRLATQIGSALQGVIYVLDEPSIGLHQRDNERLLATLRRLRDLGNTVLVVEHDEDTIRASDWVVDMGPGAGAEGGQIIAEGSPAEVARHPASLTGHFLSGRRQIAVPQKRRRGRAGQRLRVRGARGNNLRSVDVDFPLGLLICVTGVSGSGKSTLVNDTLYRGLSRSVWGSDHEAAEHAGIDGLEHVDKVIDIDQSPIGRTPRSNPATYTSVFTIVRDLFARLPDSRTRGWGPGRYSFNVKGGRCESCQGDGLLRIEMHFLPDVFVTCEHCKGERYNRETLKVRYKGKSISEVLDMTVDQAVGFLEAVAPAKKKLTTLQAVGLGYVKLGQSATTLSGGEAQRIKLSRELSKRPTGRTVYILDEPTTGLHFADVERLIAVLQALVDQGNTVVVIEHNLDVIKTADHLVDLGPEGGKGGGTVIATGTPEEVASQPYSHTGRFLAPLLGKAGKQDEANRTVA